MNINYSELNLPLHPGDVVYSVYTDNNELGYEEYKISEDRVTSVVISEDNTLQIIISECLIDFEKDTDYFLTRDEAETHIRKLKESMPIYIDPGYRIDWYIPQIYLPSISCCVLLTMKAINRKTAQNGISAFFVRNDGILKSGFYFLLPNAYNQDFDIDEQLLSSDNTVPIDINNIYAWCIGVPTGKYIHSSLPTKL